VALLQRILKTSVTGALVSVSLVSLALIAPAAGANGKTGVNANGTARANGKARADGQAGAPPAVFVRVEGARSTLLSQTLIQTKATSKVKGEVCSGTTAAGALELATRGNWRAKWFSSLDDFEAMTILGESPAATDYWALWINGRFSDTGACSTRLHAGDHELWFDCLADASGVCSNNPLALRVPSVVRAHKPVKVRVTHLDGSGGAVPAAGAAIKGSGIVAVTGPEGSATFVPKQAGVLRLHAAKSGATPSDVEFVCVYKSRRSQCGSVGKNGPRVHVAGIHEHQVFTGQGPRLLHGTAGPDPAGLTDVRLSLFRHAPGGGCSYFDASTGRWRRRGCKAATRRASFSVGAGQSWSYLLPRALSPGAYRLNVQAIDASGRQTKLVTGRSGIDFVVQA